MRMDAYYYGFAPTGVPAIDRILSAVACAGKAFHHTDQWNCEVYGTGPSGEKVARPYEPFLRGMTPVEWIQNAALDAAAQAQRDAEVVAQYETLARENYALHEETVRALAAAEQRSRALEHALGAAYLRLRMLIPGALNTPHAPTGEQVWQITEAALRKALGT